MTNWTTTTWLSLWLVLAAAGSTFAQPVTVGAVTVSSSADCVLVNPYDEPDRAQACSLFWLQSLVPPKPPVRTFQIGAVYAGPYGFTMRVIGLAATSAGTQVVTCEWVTHTPGEVFSFRNDDNWLARFFWP